jgi:hypothetical protein
VADIRKDKGGIRDPLEEGEDQAEMSGPSNSRNREESMTESGKDAFGRGSAVRNPDQTGQVGWDSDNPDSPDENQTGARRSAPTGADEFPSPRSSGTTGLGGESPDSGSIAEPGGVEGAGGNS